MPRTALIWRGPLGRCALAAGIASGIAFASGCSGGETAASQTGGTAGVAGSASAGTPGAGSGGSNSAGDGIGGAAAPSAGAGGNTGGGANATGGANASGGSAGVATVAGSAGSAGAADCTRDVYFLVDASASMQSQVGSDGGEKRNSLHRALNAALLRIPSSLTVSILSFPGGDCYERSVIADHGSPQDAAANFDLIGLGGGTPLEDMLEDLPAFLETGPAGARRYLVLIADGVPTLSLGCQGNILDPVDPQPSLDRFTALAASGVETFVIGLRNNETNDETQALFSEFAVAGGSAPACSTASTPYCHYDASNGTVLEVEQTLGDAFDDIVTRLGNCE